MASLLTAFIAALKSIFRTRAALQLEKLSLRLQIGVLRRSVKKRAKSTSADRVLWARLCGDCPCSAFEALPSGLPWIRRRPPRIEGPLRSGCNPSGVFFR